MNLVDSSGWIEFFMDGPLAVKYSNYLKDSSQLVVPTIVIYEVYKKIRREVGEGEALAAIGSMSAAVIIPLTDNLAIFAADISLKYNLAMADSIVYAAAQDNNAKLITSDVDFEKLPNTIFLRK